MDVSDSAFLGIIRGYVFYFLSPLGGYIADKLLKSTLKLYGYGFIVLAILFFITTQIPAGKDKLDNFVWFEYIRPKNKQDIFNWVPKKVTDQLKKSVRGPIELPNQHLFENKKKEE